jgi:hypothetical protein
MTTFVRLWRYLVEFFLEWEILHTKVVEKIKTHILCAITFSRKSCRLRDNVEKCGRAGQVTDEQYNDAYKDEIRIGVTNTRMRTQS